MINLKTVSFHHDELPKQGPNPENTISVTLFGKTSGPPSDLSLQAIKTSIIQNFPSVKETDFLHAYKLLPLKKYFVMVTGVDIGPLHGTEIKVNMYPGVTALIQDASRECQRITFDCVPPTLTKKHIKRMVETFSTPNTPIAMIRQKFDLWSIHAEYDENDVPHYISLDVDGRSDFHRICILVTLPGRKTPGSDAMSDLTIDKKAVKQPRKPSFASKVSGDASQPGGHPNHSAVTLPSSAPPAPTAAPEPLAPANSPSPPAPTHEPAPSTSTGAFHTSLPQIAGKKPPSPKPKTKGKKTTDQTQDENNDNFKRKRQGDGHQISKRKIKKYVSDDELSSDNDIVNS